MLSTEGDALDLGFHGYEVEAECGISMESRQLIKWW